MDKESTLESLERWGHSSMACLPLELREAVPMRLSEAAPLRAVQSARALQRGAFEARCHGRRKRGSKRNSVGPYFDACLYPTESVSFGRAFKPNQKGSTTH